ncbi:MAG: tetratricopeptide repeat protein [Desulfuromonadaceae bacterium]
MIESGDFAQGCRFFATGNYSAAENIFRQCLLKTPEDADVLNALGSALDALGSLEEAAHCLSEACRLQPESAPLHFNRANLLRKCGDVPGAEREYIEAIQHDPGLAEAYHGLGSLHFKEGVFEPAEACLRKAIELKKGFAPALHDLGQLHQRHGLREEAEQFYRQSVEGDATFMPALNSLGMLLLQKGRVEEARSCFEKALKRDQNYLQARCNLAVLDNWCGNHACAIAALQQAVIDAPNNGDIHFNLALALLSAGRFEEGWREHEWRFGKTNPVPIRYGEIPRWHGEALVSKSVLIHAEQGYGDSLQFIRFASLLASQGATVLVEGQDPTITPLLATAPGVAVAFSRDEEPPFKPDFQIPMMSLPLELGVDGVHPQIVKYLHPPEERIRFWHDTLSRLPGLKVGIAWAGRPGQENDANRSIPPEQLAPLCKLEGISWVSLQFGPHKPSPTPLSLFDPTGSVADFCDSAALIAGLDLIITVNSAAAHLAGALGKPVWLLLHWNSDWRWTHGSTYAAWYPATRIYQQGLEKPWGETINIVADDLLKFGKYSIFSEKGLNMGRREDTWGALYMVWGSSHEQLLERSINSLKSYHPDLPIHIHRVEDTNKNRASAIMFLVKAAMAKLSPFENTLYLDADTIVMGPLEYGFEKAEQFGLACCICECPWAQRYTGLKHMDGLVEYNTGVLFFTKKAQPALYLWEQLARVVDSSVRYNDKNGENVMDYNDQAAFARAIEMTGFNPYVLPINWNLRPRWQKSFFGPLRIWHDVASPPPEIASVNSYYDNEDPIFFELRMT